MSTGCRQGAKHDAPRSRSQLVVSTAAPPIPRQMLTLKVSWVADHKPCKRVQKGCCGVQGVASRNENKGAGGKGPCQNRSTTAGPTSVANLRGGACRVDKLRVPSFRACTSPMGPPPPNSMLPQYLPAKSDSSA
eukprot:1159891-Pelagomonas_calceolata.AAC.10